MAYIGNDDFRGYLAARASGPGGMDANAKRALDIRVGNDGGYDPNRLNSFYDSPMGDRTSERDAQVNWTNNEYSNWTKRNAGGSVLGSNTGTTSTTNTRSTAPATPAYNQDDVNYLDDQSGRLRRYLDSTNNTLNDGLTGIGDTYNKNVSSANSQRSQALEDFGVKTQKTKTDRSDSINNVNQNTRSLSNSLLRTIGLASGKNSSAYQQLAPSVVAKLASKERSGVDGAYNDNIASIDMATNRAKSAFDKYLEEIEAEKGQKERGLRAGVLEQQNGINQNLADIAGQRASIIGGGYSAVRQAQTPYDNVITANQAQLDGLFSRFRTPSAVQGVKVDTPTLRDYVVNKSAVTGDARQAEGGSPYARFLQKQRDEEQRV